MVLCCFGIKQGNMTILSYLPYEGQAEGSKEQNVSLSLTPKKFRKDPAASCVDGLSLTSGSQPS